MPRLRIVIIGGSLSGLIAGNLCHRMGWDVDIYERTTGVLDGRGAGITILPGLVETFRAAGVTEEFNAIELPSRMVLDRAGRMIAEYTFAQKMISWRRLYEMLNAVFQRERYHTGMTLQKIEQGVDRVTACFSNGERIDAELLIGADGSRSTMREHLLPEVKPFYPGYVAWRCLTDERQLAPVTHKRLFGRYSLCLTPGEQVIGYPVPGPNHSAAPGKRQYNVVWYHPVQAGKQLARLMTDDTGRHHPSGIAPALISEEVRKDLVTSARSSLAPEFAEAIELAKLVFFQPIVDVEVTRLVFDRVVLIGDAAFVARPHVAMGIPKAGGDAQVLVDSIAQNGNDLSSALALFEQKRLRTGAAIVARGRHLGRYMEAQLKSAEERERAERDREPLHVMMETAAPTDYELLRQ